MGLAPSLCSINGKALKELSAATQNQELHRNGKKKSLLISHCSFSDSSNIYKSIIDFGKPKKE